MAADDVNAKGPLDVEIVGLAKDWIMSEVIDAVAAGGRFLALNGNHAIMNDPATCLNSFNELYDNCAVYKQWDASYAMSRDTPRAVGDRRVSFPHRS